MNGPTQIGWGGLLFIVPILAFDIWLTLTTGRRQWEKWRLAQNRQAPALALACGLALAILCAFIVEYKNGTHLRLKGIPVPYNFSSLEDKAWVSSSSPLLLGLLARATDFLTGLAAPLLPFKFAEFLRVVKQEIQ